MKIKPQWRIQKFNPIPPWNIGHGVENNFDSLPLKFQVFIFINNEVREGLLKPHPSNAE